MEPVLTSYVENVMQFLRALIKHQLPLALMDVQKLEAIKRSYLKSSEPTSIHAWDRDYYLSQSARLSQSQIAPSPDYSNPHQSISESRDHLANAAVSSPRAFSVSAGSVINALSSLFTHIYGMSLQPRPTHTDETWHPDVWRLDVYNNDNGQQVGTIYTDMWYREGKLRGAAHYTVRCSRRVDDDDLEGDFRSEWNSTSERELLEYKKDIEDVAFNAYQLPIVALSFDFVKPAIANSPIMLSFREVETIFHEMGHAMHCKFAYRYVFQRICSSVRSSPK
jgi:intermediate peptidase